MKILPCLSFLLFMIGSNATLADYICLQTSGSTNSNYAVNSSAIVVLTGLGGTSSPTTRGYTTMNNFQLNLNQTYTGLTNIAVVGNSFFATATFSVTTPAVTGVVSNCYVPANALVIPSSVTGPVAVTLQSSTDLLNWSDATAGTYGPSLGTNRFFRVKATAQ